MNDVRGVVACAVEQVARSDTPPCRRRARSALALNVMRGVLIVILLLAALVPGSSWACSCGQPPSTEQKIDSSKDVFVVRTRSVEHFDEPQPFGNQRATIEVVDVWKGSADAYSAIWTTTLARTDYDGAQVMTSCGDNKLTAGTFFLVMARGPADAVYSSPCGWRVKAIPLWGRSMEKLRSAVLQ